MSRSSVVIVSAWTDKPLNIFALLSGVWMNGYVPSGCRMFTVKIFFLGLVYEVVIRTGGVNCLFSEVRQVERKSSNMF